MSEPRVVIVGGGLAGLAAAESLSRCHPEIPIVLLDAKRALGGRAGSYVDPTTKTETDYCQHAAMGCCTNFIDMLDQCGLSQHLRRFDELTFLHPDHPPSRFAPSRWLPPPLHLAGTIGTQHYLRSSQKREVKRGLWKLMRTMPSAVSDVIAADWLRGAGQSPETIAEFWDVILVSALGETTDRVSMSAARKVLIDGFAIARGASDVLVPTRPLAELFGRQLTSVLVDRGVEIRSGQAVQRISPERRVLTHETAIDARSVICAVPWYRVAKLFADWPQDQRSRLPDFDTISQIPGSPISGLHLWFDRPITNLDHAVMVGTVAQWLFRDPCQPDDLPGGGEQDHYYYQVVISASTDATSIPKDQLVRTVLEELRAAFPQAKHATLVNDRLVTDPKSVFSIRPEVDAIRPTTETGIDWLTLAGDWTQTGWPATMEGAVISGRLAADSVVRQWHGVSESRPSDPARSYVKAGLPAGILARLLIRHD